MKDLPFSEIINKLDPSETLEPRGTRAWQLWYLNWCGFNFELDNYLSHKIYGFEAGLVKQEFLQIISPTLDWLKHVDTKTSAQGQTNSKWMQVMSLIQ